MRRLILTFSVIAILSICDSNNSCYARGGGGGGGHCGGHFCGGGHSYGSSHGSSFCYGGHNFQGGFFNRSHLGWYYGILPIHFHQHHSHYDPYLYINSFPYWPFYAGVYPFTIPDSSYLGTSLFYPPYYMDPYYPYPDPPPANQFPPVRPDIDPLSDSQSLNPTNVLVHTAITSIDKNTESEPDAPF